MSKLSRVEIKANRILFLIKRHKYDLTIGRKNRLNKMTNQLMLQFLQSYPVKMHIELNGIELNLPMNKSGHNLTGRVFSGKHREKLIEVFSNTKQFHKLEKVFKTRNRLNEIYLNP